MGCWGGGDTGIIPSRESNREPQSRALVHTLVEWSEAEAQDAGPLSQKPKSRQLQGCHDEQLICRRTSIVLFQRGHKHRMTLYSARQNPADKIVEFRVRVGRCCRRRLQFFCQLRRQPAALEISVAQYLGNVSSRVLP